MELELEFRHCRNEDVAVLDRINPSPSVESFHSRRFARQDEGLSSYLLAWHRTTLVGHAEILWRGCADASVRTAYPACPEISGLEVFPESIRSHGIGTALVYASEDLAVERGFAHIGLGVADVNVRAAQLYQRLGYVGKLAYRDKYACVDSIGNRHEFADPCVFLTRPLPRPESHTRRLTSPNESQTGTRLLNQA